MVDLSSSFFAYTSNNIYQSYFLLVFRIIHIMFMNIHYSSHMFHNVLLISFESLRKFDIIPGISACFQQISGSQNLYIF